MCKYFCLLFFCSCKITSELKNIRIKVQAGELKYLGIVSNEKKVLNWEINEKVVQTVIPNN